MGFSDSWKDLYQKAYPDGIVRTQWSFFGHGEKKPGLLTPWSEEASVSDALWEMCVNAYHAVLTVVYAGVYVVPVIAIASLTYCDVVGDEDYFLAAFVAIPYFIVSFVSDLLISLTAMITRTLSTLGGEAVDLLSTCFGSEPASGDGTDFTYAYDSPDPRGSTISLL